MSELNKKESSAYSTMISNMLVDFVVHDMTIANMCTKYHLTSGMVYEIIRTFKFREKKVRYHDRVLEKSLKKLSTRQSAVLLKATMILERQVNRIEKEQLRNPDRLIDPNRMKEVLGAFALLSKEYRLDNGQATDNQNISIKVEMGSNVPIVSENHLQPEEPKTFDVNEEDIQIKDEDVEIKKEEPKIEEKEIEDELDNSMFGGLD